MTESLTDDLSAARNEIISLRRELENRRYLRMNQQVRRRKLFVVFVVFQASTAITIIPYRQGEKKHQILPWF